MAMAMAMEARLTSLSQQLGRKSTFEQALKSLIELVRTQLPSAEDHQRTQVIGVVSRVSTLLQSRYTSVEFWKLGLTLFRNAHGLVQNSKEKSQLQSHIKRAEEFIRENSRDDENESQAESLEREAVSASASGSYLFEGQLSTTEQPPRPPWLVAQSAHLAILNALYQAPLSVPTADGTPASTAQGSLNSANDPSPQSSIPDREGTTEGDPDENGMNDNNPSHEATDELASLQNRVNRLNQLLESLNPPHIVETTPGDPDQTIEELLGVFRTLRNQIDQFMGDTDALEAALQATLNDAPRGSPPASKEEVEKLPVFKMDVEKMKVQGKCECTICREDYSIDDYMQKMPCDHIFHLECLSPWLKLHNSCPVCRYEMKTDDAEYERRKEIEKQVEEERRGIENAVQEGAYMYL